MIDFPGRTLRFACLTYKKKKKILTVNKWKTTQHNTENHFRGIQLLRQWIRGKYVTYSNFLPSPLQVSTGPNYSALSITKVNTVPDMPWEHWRSGAVQNVRAVAQCKQRAEPHISLHLKKYRTCSVTITIVLYTDTRPYTAMAKVQFRAVFHRPQSSPY